jgi:AcrR family transcriptional regulator
MNHVMTGSSAVARDLRDEHVAATRRRIARAVVEVLVTDGSARLSFPAVAERAGVSLRTVYRHFPNKEALLAAALHAGSEEFSAAYPMGERRLDSLAEFIPMLFAEIDANRDLVTVQHTTPAGIALRGERMRRRQVEVRQIMQAELPEVPEQERARLADLVTVLISSSMLLDLVDQLGVSVEEAAALVVFAVEAATERTGSKGEVR